MVVSAILHGDSRLAHACGTPGDCGVAIALTDTVSNSHPQAGDTITYNGKRFDLINGSPATINSDRALEAGLTFVSAYFFCGNIFQFYWCMESREVAWR